jgi:hypothetical protein
VKLTIDRARWGRGVGEGRLLSDGKMCCLGFLAKACGLSDTAIEDLGNPSDVYCEEPTKHKQVWNSMGVPFKKPRKLKELGEAMALETVFVLINDDENLTEKRRERLLTKEFAKIGVNVEFVG